MKMLPPSQLDIDWFHRKYLKKGMDECWLWQAGKFDGRYGQYHYNNYPVLAHRFMFLLHNPEFDQRLFVCHSCDNPLCVNPNHLFLGTQQDNENDKISKNRHCFGEKNGGAILTESQVIEIKAKYKTGQYSQRKLAKLYNISQAMIWNIVNDKYWRHLQLQDVGTVPAIV